MIKRPCTHGRCPSYAVSGSSKCSEHKAEADKKRFAGIKRNPDGQRMYNTTQWRTLRALHLKRQPYCVECEKGGHMEPGSDVDHIRKHNGNARLFYDANNLQTLCKKCHWEKTKRGE